MVQVKAHIAQQHYATTVSTATNTLVADEPVANGGTAAGMAPEELLGASLASCTAITLRMYADRKGFALTDIEVNVAITRDAAQGTTVMERHITLQGALTDEERNRLLTIANKCPIHKILSGQVTIKTDIV